MKYKQKYTLEQINDFRARIALKKRIDRADKLKEDAFFNLVEMYRKHFGVSPFCDVKRDTFAAETELLKELSRDERFKIQEIKRLEKLTTDQERQIKILESQINDFRTRDERIRDQIKDHVKKFDGKRIESNEDIRKYIKEAARLIMLIDAATIDHKHPNRK